MCQQQWCKLYQLVYLNTSCEQMSQALKGHHLGAVVKCREAELREPKSQTDTDSGVPLVYGVLFTTEFKIVPHMPK